MSRKFRYRDNSLAFEPRGTPSQRKRAITLEMAQATANSMTEAEREV